MGLVRRAGWIITLGSLIALIAGIANLTGHIQLFGADGITLPGWAAVILSPIAALAGLTLAQAGHHIDQRTARRRATRNTARRARQATAEELNQPAQPPSQRGHTFRHYQSQG